MSEIFPSENLQRVGFLAIIPRLLRRFGADPEEVLAAAGLPVDALDNADAVIPFAAAGRLLQLSADRTQCPHFGLEMAQPIRTASLGIVGELMRKFAYSGCCFAEFRGSPTSQRPRRSRLLSGRQMTRHSLAMRYISKAWPDIRSFVTPPLWDRSTSFLSLRSPVLSP